MKFVLVVLLLCSAANCLYIAHPFQRRIFLNLVPFNDESADVANSSVDKIASPEKIRCIRLHKALAAPAYWLPAGSHMVSETQTSFNC
uniref:Secreted protein n=1 Tax=Steinernema glaseri TaxID=37863 RepID=A0A1I7ZTC2_9BILA